MTTQSIDSQQKESKSASSNTNIMCALDLLAENRTPPKDASTPANEKSVANFLEIPPLAWPKAKEIQAKEKTVDLFDETETSSGIPSNTSANNSATSTPVCKGKSAQAGSLRSGKTDVETAGLVSKNTGAWSFDSFHTPTADRPIKQNPESSAEALVESIAGLDKFDRLLESVSRIPDGALKDLHYAALEGILQGELPVDHIQNLIPAAGKQFCDLFGDAQTGGTVGLSALHTLREFQNQLSQTFSMQMEMSDFGLYLSEGRDSGANAWTFIPTSGKAEAGANYVRGFETVALELQAPQVLSRLRDRLSGALNFPAVAS